MGTIAKACLLAAFGIGMASSTFAASVQEIANYKGADRQAVLEAGAKKEGKVVIYCTGTQLDSIAKALETKYPFMKVELYRLTPVEVARRVIEEYKAGSYNVDTFELSSTGLIPINTQDIVIPFYTPEQVGYADEAWGPGRKWLAARESYVGFGVNTNIIPLDKAPKSFDDLLKPEMKGKMGLVATTSTANTWVGTLLLTKGEEFVKKVGQQDIRGYDMTGRALANLTISGEVPFSPTTFNSHVFESKKDKAPIEWIDPDAVSVIDTSVTVAKNAPHPNAAMLMIDFALSKEGQNLYMSIGYNSPRSDVQNAGTVPKKKLYLGSRPNFLEEFEEWGKLYERYVKRPNSKS
jgi:iron(III) transport system substrate-binding protein